MTTTVLVTGAARGVGRGLTEVFLSRPNHTVIAAVRDASAPTAASLRSFVAAPGSSVVVVKLDSAIDSDATTAIKEIQGAGIEHLDIVIANAGIQIEFARLEAANLKSLKEMHQVNAVGPLALYQATYPLLKKTADVKGPGAPVFIGISTVAASIQNLEANTPYQIGSYGSTKASLNYLVRRAHFETEWLTAFVIEPGWVQTDLGNSGAELFGFKSAEVPLKDSVDGIMKHVDAASREKSSGKFFSWDGSEMLY
ncbi:hypothetical protein GGR54DRAFT_633383 [Hypoxylon sp. NC1633]|nr:hypothetical protein GGR54DRAFT_633383 [Hypoxylon sp. NC1633]